MERNLKIGIIALGALFVVCMISLYESYTISSLNYSLTTRKSSTESGEVTVARRRCMNEYPFQVFSHPNLTKFAHPLRHDEFVSQTVLNSQGNSSKLVNANIRDKILKVLSVAHDPLVLDIGANIGLDTVFIANAGYRVHAFEPLKMNHPILHCDLIVNGFNESQVKINTFGLSRQKEDLCMKSSVLNASRTTLTIDRDCGLKNLASFQRLDEYLETWMKGEVPYLIKIDTAGYELHALETAKEYFKKHGAPKHIFTQWSPTYLKRAGIDNAADYLNFLWDIGMTITHNGNVVSKDNDHYRKILSMDQTDLHAYLDSAYLVAENGHSCFVDPRKLLHQLSSEDSYTVVRNIHNECATTRMHRSKSHSYGDLW